MSHLTGADALSDTLYRAISRGKLSKSGLAAEILRIYKAGYKQSQNEFLARLEEYKGATDARQDIDNGDNASRIGDESGSSVSLESPGTLAAD